MSEATMTEALRLPNGPVSLADHDPRAVIGFDGDKRDAEREMADMASRMSDLQECLFARGRSHPERARRVLLVLQGMDTAGKGGVIRHAIGMVDPQGVSITAFKKPTPEELSHDFLWRIRKAVPERGRIGIFDRSHYEDVLIARVESLVSPDVWRERYAAINAFEADLVEQDTVIIKCFLNVSRDEQKERLLERLDNPEKHWKYNPGDLDARAKWDQYQDAYADALERCHSDVAPWYVIPSDRKWYRNLAVARILLEHLERMDIHWPVADFEVAAERMRLLRS